MTRLEEILEVACKLYYQQGIKSVSMDDIAESLAISKKTLYNTVSNKNELLILVTKNLSSIFIKSLHDINERNNITQKEKLKHIAKFILTFTCENFLFIQQLKNTHRRLWVELEYDQHTAILKIMGPIYQELRKEKLLKRSVNKDLLNFIFLGMCKVKKDHLNSMENSQKRIEISELLIDGLFVNIEN
ncbi:TetR/AcrR family transcriptional regulator [Christiangramia sp.]|uniref:TetR/AcrR family transcriptional regulator n=1 Tax=Christiangramia sp. TaxID=1931228 RepID=UPI00262CF2E4|nr:TetR/AcrR family transcriptional regulator [Christiangramia sp.]